MIRYALQLTLNGLVVLFVYFFGGVVVMLLLEKIVPWITRLTM